MAEVAWALVLYSRYRGRRSLSLLDEPTLLVDMLHSLQTVIGAVGKLVVFLHHLIVFCS